MGAIFKNPTTRPRPRTYRQSQYLNAKKTDRAPVVKREQEMQLELCAWLRTVLPDVHFRSDTASGAFNSEREKDIHNRQQSSTAEPDLMILAARKGYHGLMIELKAAGTNLKMKRDGTKIRVVKNSRGKIISRDYKIRKKGDWANLHIEQQAKCLEDYNAIGYRAAFAVGIEQAKKFICWYFDLEYIEQPELF